MEIKRRNAFSGAKAFLSVRGDAGKGAAAISQDRHTTSWVSGGCRMGWV